MYDIPGSGSNKSINHKMPDNDKSKLSSIYTQTKGQSNFLFATLFLFLFKIASNFLFLFLFKIDRFYFVVCLYFRVAYNATDDDLTSLMIEREVPKHFNDP